MLSETLRELSNVLGSSLDLNSVLDDPGGLERVVPYTAGLICWPMMKEPGDRRGARRHSWAGVAVWESPSLPKTRRP